MDAPPPPSLSEHSATFRLAAPYSPHRKVIVDFSPTRHQRSAHPDLTVEASIESTWVKRNAANPTLFNARKFRLSLLTLTPPSARTQFLTLHLGLTDYREYLGTHVPADRIATPFPTASRALPLGNSAVVVTRDGMCPLLVRSAASAEAPGALAFPGGYAEPDAVLGNSLREGDARVARELREAVRREVIEETFLEEANVPDAGTFELLGVVERRRDRKCTMVYCVWVGVNGAEMKARYEEANIGKEESVRMHVVRVKELADMAGVCERAGGLSAVDEMLGGAQLWVQRCANKDGVGQ